MIGERAPALLKRQLETNREAIQEGKLQVLSVDAQGAGGTLVALRDKILLQQQEGDAVVAAVSAGGGAAAAGAGGGVKKRKKKKKAPSSLTG